MVRVNVSRSNMGEGPCLKHHNKVIFLTEKEAKAFIILFHPHSRMDAYRCPIEKHYHTRDLDKRKAHKQARNDFKRQRKRRERE